MQGKNLDLLVAACLLFGILWWSFIGHGSRMLERLSKDASQLHEDMILQLHQMQDTVRYTFFECFLALAGKYYAFQIGYYTIRLQIFRISTVLLLVILADCFHGLPMR